MINISKNPKPHIAQGEKKIKSTKVSKTEEKRVIAKMVEIIEEAAKVREEWEKEESGNEYICK